MAKTIKKIINADDVEWELSLAAALGDEGKVKWLVSKNANGAPDMGFGLGIHEPGEIHLLHHHEKNAEVYYVISGTAKITVDDEVIQAKPGTCIYMPPGCKHRIENNGKEQFILVWANSTSADMYQDCTTIFDEGPYKGDKDWIKKLRAKSAHEHKR